MDNREKHMIADVKAWLWLITGFFVIGVLAGAVPLTFLSLLIYFAFILIGTFSRVHTRVKGPTSSCEECNAPRSPS